MATTAPPLWQAISAYAVCCPSPHNTQPFRLHPTGERTAEVVFLPDRGLYVADPHGRFTWLTAGIFVEICVIAAHGQQHELALDWLLTPMYAGGDHTTPQVVARLTLTPAAAPVNDLDPELIRQRQTSRLPYDGRTLPDATIQLLQAEAQRHGHTFTVSTKAQDIAWVKTLNKNSLFNDLADAGIREELKHWLRYSKHEAHTQKDGLSAECLHLPGPLLRSFMYHHKVWTAPVLKQIVDKIYLGTMRGIGTIGWLQGPYQTEQDWVRAGQTMIRLWLLLTREGAYWHPYGSVITNDKSRTEMLHNLGLPDESNGKNMIWLLLRMGYSQPPPKSERLPLESILV